jgi:flagellum-specific ATP synthase
LAAEKNLALSHGLERLGEAIGRARENLPMVKAGGRVTAVAETHYEVCGLSHHVDLGGRISISQDGQDLFAEVIRIDGDRVTAKPFEGRPVQAGCHAWQAQALRLFPHSSWKGRVLNAFGQPADRMGPLAVGSKSCGIDGHPPPAMLRQRVSQPFKTGVRVIDIFTPVCFGQRLGVFAGSGVGKSTLLGMLARGGSQFDMTVLALIGERGREVREFIEDTLGLNRHNIIMVVATSDETALMRRLAAQTALAIACHFRDLGGNVLLAMDSLTRFAHAAREVALASGELPVARGYPPSVFGALAKLVERCGPGPEGAGSITGFFTVLVDGDDHNDPVADTARGLLDGHIVLDRAIAEQARFPAVNVLSSISRCAHLCWSADERKLVRRFVSLISRYEDTRDVRLIGGSMKGADADFDKAVELVPKLYAALCQGPDEAGSADAFHEIAELLRS